MSGEAFSARSTRRGMASAGVTSMMRLLSPCTGGYPRARTGVDMYAANWG